MYSKYFAVTCVNSRAQKPAPDSYRGLMKFSFEKCVKLILNKNEVYPRRVED
jgi:hypothetical protein